MNKSLINMCNINMSQEEINYLKQQLAEKDALIEQLRASQTDRPSIFSRFSSSLANKSQPKTQALRTKSIKFLSNLVGNVITIHFPKNIETSP